MASVESFLIVSVRLSHSPRTREDDGDPARHLINGFRFSETQSHLRDQKERQEEAADH